LKSKRSGEIGSLEKIHKEKGGSKRSLKAESRVSFQERKPGRSKKVVTINSEVELLGDHEKPKKPLNLKQMLWAMVYPSFFTQKISEKVKEKKKKVDQTANKDLERQSSTILQFFQKHCQSSLKSIYKASKCQLVKDEEFGDRDISESNIKKRFLNVVTKLTVLMQDVNRGLDKAGLPAEFVEYFKSITDNGCILPPRLLTEYEASLLEFSYFGTLKNMSPAKLKMILASFFLIKKLTLILLSKPWEFTTKVKKSLDLGRNLRNFGSVLYLMVMNNFKDLKQNKNNQAFIDPDRRVKVLKPLVAHDVEGIDSPRRKHEALHSEILVGLYRRTLLDVGYDTYGEEVNNLKILVEECIKKLYEQVVFIQAKNKEDVVS